MESLKVLFVCIGNTCRSPMAESVMLHWIAQHHLNWKADSAGLRNWNVGYEPEERCIKVLAEHGMATTHVGRMITTEDFFDFDYILGMDNSNMRELRALAVKAGEGHTAKIELLGSYIGRKEDEIIQDPYFSDGISSFRSAFEQINESCQNFINTHKQILN